MRLAKRRSSYFFRGAPASSQSLHETLDLFLTREAAEAELLEILEDEPEWVNVLRVLPIELDGRNLSGTKKKRPGWRDRTAPRRGRVSHWRASRMRICGESLPGTSLCCRFIGA